MAAIPQPAKTLPFVGSVDRKTHPHLLQPPDFTELINVDLHQPGAIMKRRGYEQIGATSSALGSTLSSVTTMQAYKGQPLLGQRNGNRYMLEEALDDMASVGVVGAVSATAAHSALPVSAELAVGTGTPPLEGVIDYTRCGDYEGVILLSGRLLIRNRETGAILSSTTGLALGAPRAITIGTVIYFVYKIGAQITVYYRDTANFTGNTVSVATLNDAHATQHCLDVTTDGTFLYVAYRTGATTLKVAKLTAAAVVSGATATVVGSDPDAIAIYYSDSGFALIVAYWDSTLNDVMVQGYNTSLVAQSAHSLHASAFTALSVAIGVGTSSSKVRVYWTEDAGSGNQWTSYKECNLDGSTSGATLRTCYGVGLGSKPMRTGDQDFVVLYQLGGFAATSGMAAFVGLSATLARVTDAAGGFDPLCAIHVGSAFYPYPLYYQMVPALIEGDEAGTLYTVTSGTGQVFGDGAPAFYVSTFRVDAHTGLYVEPALYLRGGCVYDGTYTPLCGFLWAPKIETAVAGTTGSMTASSTYSYIAIYEFTDSNGTIHRSAPSPAKQAILAVGDDSCALTIRTLLDRRASAFQALGRIVLYRTAANGTVYYRLTAVGPTAANSFASVSLNAAYTDTEADTTLTDNEILYTQGGAQLANYPMPAGAALELHDGRLWVAGDDGAVWASKELLPYEGAAFNPAITIDTRGLGQPVALCGLETAIAFFWRNAIGYVYGQGPNDAGQGSSYTGVQLISGNTIGCNNAASVVRTPVGVMFESEHGIYVLPPGGGAPMFVGERIEEEREGETIVGAQVLHDRQCVAFTCGSGKVLNFWYSQNRWSWDVLEGDGEGGGEIGALGSCISGGRHTVLRSGDKLYRQADDVWRDEFKAVPEFVPTTLTTGWIALDGLQGLVRIWNLYLLAVGEDLIGCGVRMTIWADRDESGDGDVYDFDMDALQSFEGQALEVRAHMRTQQLKAMKLQIVDHNEAGDSLAERGMTWTGLRIDWGGTGKGPRLGRESAVK